MSKDINAVLANWAGQQEEDDLSRFEGVEQFSLLADALKAKVAAQKQKAAEEAAEVILGLLESRKRYTEEKVLRIRSIRAEEKKLLNDLAVLERAEAYGNETSDFRPLAYALWWRRQPISGLYAQEVPIAYVPEDWVPKAKRVTKK